MREEEERGVGRGEERGEGRRGRGGQRAETGEGVVQGREVRGERKAYAGPRPS